VLGITIKGAPGLGDKLQFSSFPENYYRNTGEKVIDLDEIWLFDHNPYVVRGVAPTKVNHLFIEPWPAMKGVNYKDFIAKPVFFSLAERACSIFGHTDYLRHPRLYRFEDLPMLEKRVVLHTTGQLSDHLTGEPSPPKSQFGEDQARVLSEEILEHVRRVYSGYEIIQIGSKQDRDARVIDCRGLPDIWETVKIVAQASVFIGVDSGPYWIAACYPRVFRKKVMVQYSAEYLRRHFVPMHMLQGHVHWHDYSCLYFNRTTEDAGVTYSYLKL
jgi:hypothetical protein